MPYGLVGVLEYIKQHYGNPAIYIHENGDLSLSLTTFSNDTEIILYITKIQYLKLFRMFIERYTCAIEENNRQ